MLGLGTPNELGFGGNHMATTPPRTQSHRVDAATVLIGAAMALLVVLAALAAPQSADAATTAPNYRLDSLRYANGVPVGTCRGWGADADDAGNFYMACPVMRDLDGNGTGDVQAPALYEMDATGKVIRLGWLPTEYAFNDYYPVRDVGVAPDGNTAYVSVGPNMDNLGLHPEKNPTTKQPMANGATQGSILRLVRQPDGSWLYDAAFKAGPFQIAGGNYWAIRYVDIDATGRIYVTVNSYVYELSPTTGQVVSAFGGGQTAWPGGPWVEGFDTPEGLAVSADGNSIYIVEQQHHLVQRWTRVGATDWVRDRSFLIGRPSEERPGLCASNAHLQSPYDVGVDVSGDLYVIDTSCQRIQRYTSTGAYIQTVWTNVGGDDMNHGLAVNWQGSIVLPIEEDLLVRLDPPARPAPTPAPKPAPPVDGGGDTPRDCTDRTGPRMTGVKTVRRSRTRRIAVTAFAKDDCGITHVRVLGQRLGRSSWVAGNRLIVPLGGWNGRKRLVAQVRDAAGRTSIRRFTVTMALPQPRLRARTTVRLRGSRCSSVDPMRRVSGYRLVDRCARIGGRVLVAKRRGRSWSLQVLVSTSTARALYENAVGPVKVWVVTDSSTRTSGRIGRGRSVVVDGSLVAERSRSAVHAVPVDRVYGR